MRRTQDARTVRPVSENRQLCSSSMFQHVQDTENAEVNNVKTRFDLLLPGQTGTVCNFFEKGTCQKGDRCPFVHPGDEKKQEAMSLVMEKERAQTVVHGKVGLPLAIKNF